MIFERRKSVRLIFLDVLFILQILDLAKSEGITGRIGSWAEIAEEINIFTTAKPRDSRHNEFSDGKGTPLYHKEFCGEPNVISSFKRIVGGTEVPKGSVPWQAGISLLPAKGESTVQTITCGGTLLTEFVVITAAHCLNEPPSRYEVHLGRHHSDLKSEECHEQVFKIMKYYKHPDFDKVSLKNDIAVLSIRSFYGQGVQFSRWVVPACIGYGDFYTTHSKGTVTGWGLLDESKQLVVTPLNKVDLPIVEPGRCISAYKKVVKIDTDIQFCAGETEGGKDACSGDSGGPFTRLVSSSVGSREFLAGVVSYGIGCARAQYPGVYAKITSFLPWIKDHIQAIHDQTEPSNHSKPTRPYTTTSRPSTTTKTTTTTARTTKYRPTTTEKTTTEMSVYDYSDYDVKEIGPVCADSYRYLFCTANQQMKILSVFYGREDKTVCGGYGREVSARAASLGSSFRDCEYEEALQDFKQYCKGKRFCYLTALTSDRGGPFNANKCEKMNPYVTVKYACLEKKFEVSTKVRTETEEICEKSSISCDTGFHLQILSAVLKRDTVDECGGIYVSRRKRNSLPCEDDVLETVQKFCNNRRFCNLWVSRFSRFSKCRSMHPYLAIKYSCISGEASVNEKDAESDLDDNDLDGGPPTTSGGVVTSQESSDLSDNSVLWEYL